MEINLVSNYHYFCLEIDFKKILKDLRKKLFIWEYKKRAIKQARWEANENYWHNGGVVLNEQQYNHVQSLMDKAEQEVRENFKLFKKI